MRILATIVPAVVVFAVLTCRVGTPAADRPPSPCLRLRGHTEAVWSLEFSRDGRRLVSGSSDGTAKIWDLDRGECLVSVQANRQQSVHNVALSPDGKLLATSDNEPRVQLWDTVTGKFLARLGEGVCALGFSPDRKLLATSGYHGLVQLWDVAGRELVGDLPLTPKVPAPTIHCLAFSPDGKTLAGVATMRPCGCGKCLRGDCGRRGKGTRTACWRWISAPTARSWPLAAGIRPSACGTRSWAGVCSPGKPTKGRSSMSPAGPAASVCSAPVGTTWFTAGTCQPAR
jgi:WD40 repeat protein